MDTLKTALEKALALSSEEPIEPNILPNFREHTYEIVSKVGFLTGIRHAIFENENEPLQKEWFTKLTTIKTARIVRNLSILRNSIFYAYAEIKWEIYYNFKNLDSLPDHIPQEVLSALQADGLQILKANCTIEDYIATINSYISQNIDACKSMFPLWLQWSYVKDLFIVPKNQDLLTVINIFRSNMKYYPYQRYINWEPQDCGNIFYNDKKFCQVLYQINGRPFLDEGKVSDASQLTKKNIYDFLEQSKKVIIVVDCENSDPYKLTATLKNLDEEYLRKISTIILFDDVHTAKSWQLLEKFTDVKIKYELVDRILQNKSLVDMKLSTSVCSEFYEKQVDSFILVSSDSDYWGLISSLPKANFLVMVEYSKCSPTIKAKMVEHGIYYCHIDDFCTGNAEQLKIFSLLEESRHYISEHTNLNIHQMLTHSLQVLRTEMNESEKKQFYNRYLKTLHLEIDKNGDVKLLLGK